MQQPAGQHAPPARPVTASPWWSTVVRALREARGVTQDGWAASLGVSGTTVQRWERGVAAPTAEVEARLVALCQDKGLFRTFTQGSLAGLTLTPEWLRDLLAEARLGTDAGHLSPAASLVPPAAARPELPTGTVTLLFTDIEGSTRLLQHLGARYADVLAVHFALLRAAWAAYGGHEIDTAGDACFVVFARAPEAVAAAVAAQHALAAQPWPSGGAVRVRMGLHTGHPQRTAEGYVGIDLHRGARLCMAGHGGQVLLSHATAQLVSQDLPPGIALHDLGTHHLKDLAQPEHLFQLVISGLPAAFPPLRAVDTGPATNLPVPLTRFVGREREVAEVTRLLSGTRLLTLTGTGGVGKTRLALQVGKGLLTAYLDGVWFVDLAPLADPALVPQAVAGVLGVPERPGQPLPATLTDVLRPRRLLLVLDNCEHLVAACAALAETVLAAGPGVRVLATSREPLGLGGETVYRVPSLALPAQGLPLPVVTLSQFDAVQLFVDRAAAVLPGFALTDANAGAIAQVCTRLDGIPLALELAAARVRALAVEQLAARLGDRLRLLTGGSRTALPRQQTLRATLDWSWELLTEPEQEVLRRLAVFAGGCTLEAAEAVCAGEGVAAGEVLDLLTHLVDKSLVLAAAQEGAERYRLLETVRQYSHDQLVAAGEAEATRERHTAWYLALAEAAASQLRGRDAESWQARLDAEHDNLRAALAWALGGDHGELALRLAGALGEFWSTRGYLTPGRRWLEQALGQMQATDDGVGRATALGAAGLLATSQADFGVARACFAEALARFQALGDPRGSSLVLSWLGWVLNRQGDQAAARQRLEEGLALAREVDDTYTIAFALEWLGAVAIAGGDDAAARDLLEQSLVAARKLGHLGMIGGALNGLGELARVAGEYARAAALYEESLGLGRRRSGRSIAIVLANLGWARLRQGDHMRARACLVESLTLSQEMGNPRIIALCLAGLAGVVGARGQPERAVRLLGAAAAAEAVTGTHPLDPADQRDYDDTLAAARAQLPEATAAAAWAAGRALPREQAIAEALAESISD